MKTVPDMMLKVGIEVHLNISKMFNMLLVDNQDDISCVAISLMNSAEACPLVQQRSPVLRPKKRIPLVQTTYFIVCDDHVRNCAHFNNKFAAGALVVAEDTFWLNLRRTSHQEQKVTGISHLSSNNLRCRSNFCDTASNLLSPPVSQQPAVVSENSLQNVTCQWPPAELSQLQS